MSFFVVTICQCYLPNRMRVNPAREINVVDQSQAENRFVPVQEAEIRCEITTVTKTTQLL